MSQKCAGDPSRLNIGFHATGLEACRGLGSVELKHRRSARYVLELVAYFDNGKHAICGTDMLEVNIPEGSKVLEYITIQSCLKPFTSKWELSDEEVRRAEEASSTVELGGIGRKKGHGHDTGRARSYCLKILNSFHTYC